MIQVFILLAEQTVAIYTMELIVVMERNEQCFFMLWWLGLQGKKIYAAHHISITYLKT